MSTHFKTTVANDDGKTRDPFDWDRVLTMFAAHGYRGYLGLEFEAAGDPAVEVPATLRRLKQLAVKSTRRSGFARTRRLGNAPFRG